jgi:hypothetical protein
LLDGLKTSQDEELIDVYVIEYRRREATLKMPLFDDVCHMPPAFTLTGCGPEKID